MLRGVLVDEPPVAGHVPEKHPAGAAAKRVAHRPELGAPALERAEFARQDLGHARGRLPVAAEAREVELVQQRRKPAQRPGSALDLLQSIGISFSFQVSSRNRCTSRERATTPMKPRETE